MSDPQTTPVFCAGLRTPFSRAFRGAFASVRPDDLLVDLLGELRRREAWLAERAPDDVIVGCAYPEGEQGYNVARTAALGAGFASPAATVSRLCASSLEAVITAAARVRAGWSDCLVVGGVESMSRIPRRGANFTPSARIEAAVPSMYVGMGETAERVARDRGIARDAQEELAAESHRLAHEAWERGDYAGHVWAPSADATRDEGIRFPANREKMASLAPAFDPEGVVTAATSSPLSDGAAAGLVLSEAEARRRGVRDGLRVVAATWGQVAPEVMGMGPVPAVRDLWRRTGLGVADIAAFEVNEAFAVQVLACARELELPLGRTNTWGGAIALGHPLGASGLRLVITLLARLRAAGEPGARGLATLCVGGGQGVALLGEYVRWEG